LAADTETNVTVDFWEVGQGDCCVITTGKSNELVVIDVGPVNSVFVQWLAKRAATPFVIKRLILTHNHIDHVGGMKALFRLAHVTIESVYIVDDIVGSEDRRRILELYWAELFERRSQGHVKEIVRIEPTRGTEFVIWSEGPVRLVGLAPEIDVNLTRKNQDSTSAILALFVRDVQQFLWGGDADLRSVAQHIGGRAVEVLHGPHHGAPKDRYSSGFSSAVATLKANYAVFSLGTSNRYNTRAANSGRPQDFPNGKYVKDLAAMGCSVRCTQLTTQCDAVRGCIDSRAHVVQGSMLLGLIPARGVACRGAMRWTLVNTAFMPDPYFAKHDELVGRLEKPLCR
jgi:beta-lactamase superfamily II metal-dependent hydrolase